MGCEAFASDLNPVACLILKVMLKDIPRNGAKLAEELRRVGGEMKKQAEKELAQYYPPDPDGATPIAYLWARTVRCESPLFFRPKSGMFACAGSRSKTSSAPRLCCLRPARYIVPARQQCRRVLCL